MAEERVLPCVTKALTDAGLTPGPGENAEKLGHDYLEKLLNMRFAVPTMTIKDAERMFAGEDQVEADFLAKHAGVRWRQWVNVWVPFVGTILLVLSIFVAAWFVPSWIPKAAGPPAAGAIESKPSASPTPTPIPTPTPAGTSNLMFPPSPAAVVTPSPRIIHLDWVGYSGLFLLVILGIWRLAREPRMFSKSSQDFTEALQKWTPLIFLPRATPRALKRFLNHLRFLDARQSARREVGERLFDRLRGKVKNEYSVPKQLEAEDLVRIATLFYCFPTWCHADPLPDKFVELSGPRQAEISASALEAFDDLAKGTSFFRAVGKPPMATGTEREVGGKGDPKRETLFTSSSGNSEYPS